MCNENVSCLGGGGGCSKGKEMKEGISDKHTYNTSTSLSFLCSENSDTPLKSETLSGYINRLPDDIPTLANENLSCFTFNAWLYRLHVGDCRQYLHGVLSLLFYIISVFSVYLLFFRHAEQTHGILNSIKL